MDSNLEKDFSSEDLYNISKASSDKVFMLRPWDAKAYDYAQTIVAFLEQMFPGFSVYFIGSLALKLPGSNDVDMNVYCGECSSEDIATHARKISEKYGGPLRVEPTIAQWVFEKDGVHVDIILYNSVFEGANAQVALHQKLLHSKQLQDEYKAMKERVNGRSERDYAREKIIFFRKVTEAMSQHISSVVPQVRG